MAPMKRVYYYTPPEFALENLQNKHLKVTRFSQCNDPFELASFNQKNKVLRKKFQIWLADMDTKYGVLCFCRSWRNPVMWAHNSKNHTGVCYGFDVEPQKFIDVRYVSERLYPNLTPENFTKYVSINQNSDLFATKFIHWSYEEEVRLLIPISDAASPNRNLFHPFLDSLILREVIVGPKSKIKASEIGRASCRERV